MRDVFQRFYFYISLHKPAYTWALILLFAALSTWTALDFKLDASADSLVLENDKDLRDYRVVRARYGSDDFLVVTYTPKQDLFSAAVQADLKKLQQSLEALTRVESVMSIFNVPLIESPPMSLSELRQHVRTLESADTDQELARAEFRNSPLYRELLSSTDGHTTSLLVNFKREAAYQDLLKQRDRLWEKAGESDLSAAENARLEQLSAEIKQHNTRLQTQMQADIAAVRAILADHREQADIHLGGVPMIASDMIDFVRNDIRIFGVGVALFIVALLAVAFRRVRWVMVPLLICAVTLLGTVGWLGLMDWRVTVVSSNFISLLLIITLSLTVHLIVRHQELHAENPTAKQSELLYEVLRSKFEPAFYTVSTTMVAFASLMVSDLRPVIDFGWMMFVGVGLSLIIAFLLFPAALASIVPGTPIFRRHDATAAITHAFAHLIERFSSPVLLIYVLIAIFSVIGISRLSVENRFIDYFKDNTEIHQGMLLLDRELGGTTPLDIVLDAPPGFGAAIAEEEEHDEELDFLDELFAAQEKEAGLSGSSYWYNIFQLRQVQAIHAYLESLPETGKVLSLATTMAMVTTLNNNEPLDNFSLAVMHRQLPEDLKQILFDPYMAEDGNQIRFGIRMIDSSPDLRRDAFLKQLHVDLQEKFGLHPEQIHLSGMMVLYNNVLQSLFRSQILTLSAVFLVISLMLMLLFRSFKLALIGIMPTLTAAALILGLMGWLNIALDIMTITIAAITIGIGVDNTIHYIHRFKLELPRDQDYWGAVKRCHASVGRAIYYTSVTVTLGFSILALSNFIPMIYFGLLTGLAMVIALLANLTLLPLLLVKFKPLGEYATQTRA
jgi:uncharacterized protein